MKFFSHAMYLILLLFLLVQSDVMSVEKYTTEYVLTLLEDDEKLNNILSNGKEDLLFDSIEEMDEDIQEAILTKIIDMHWEEHVFMAEEFVEQDISDFHQNYVKQHFDYEYQDIFSWSEKGDFITSQIDKEACSCWSFLPYESDSKIDRIRGGKVPYSIEETQYFHTNVKEQLPIKFWFASCKELSDIKETNESCTNIHDQCQAKVYDNYYYYFMDYTGKKRINKQEKNALKHMKASIYNDGPAYLIFNLYDDFIEFWNENKKDDVYKQSNPKKSYNDAAFITLAIGWNDEKKAWLCTNILPLQARENANKTFWMSYHEHELPIHYKMINIISKKIGALEDLTLNLSRLKARDSCFTAPATGQLRKL